MDGGEPRAGGSGRSLGRRAALLLPLLLAACGGEEEEDEVFPPLSYNYLPPIELKVASISVEQRFVPAGLPPDISNLDPVQPVDALKAMANDRLTPFGTDNKAVVAIQNATLTKRGDAINGTFQVTLSILDASGNRLGFATAQVNSQHTGPVGNIRKTLYDVTKSAMANMNVEFEYQIRKNLQPWLTSATAPDQPVQQTPLDQSGNPVPPQGSTPPTPVDQTGVDQTGVDQTGAGQPAPQPGTAPGAPTSPPALAPAPQPGAPAPIQLNPPSPATSAGSVAPPAGSPGYPGGYLVPPSTNPQ